MNLDDALNTFVIESRELLEQMETCLLQAEQQPDDPDTIGAIFRAAHTIKGSAGLFGLDHIVAFTHVAENVLDRVRSHELTLDAQLVALLLAVGDHISTLIDQVESGAPPDEETLKSGDHLATGLRAYLGCSGSAAGQADAKAIQSQAAQPQAAQGMSGCEDLWHLSLRFGPDVLRNGMDPFAFLRYLGTFGTVEHIVTLIDGVPSLSQMDAESNYLGFQVGYRTSADKAAIEGAFEFVRDDAQIRILPPHSKMSEYLALIDELGEEDLRLGEILVRCGTVTRAELDAALASQAETGTSQPLGAVLVEEKRVHQPVVDAALERQRQVKECKAGEQSVIRVNAEKLDEHINLIGELIIASASINVTAQRQHMAELLEAASLLARLVEEIRDSALQLRMVPIGATFNKFQRVVRDVSRELGKDIRLEISGADTELDKTVVEKIGDPLTHLVRNSMDHGIESADERVARGKPAHGTVRLNAYHDAGSIVIDISDDGGGLDKDRILNKAIERGLVKPDQPLSDSEIYNLIFAAGLSTAQTVNNLSGRGVGMDVVRRNITALRGSIDIDTRPGLGTTMQIRLPLTLAIIDGFLVGVGTSSFVIPLDMVEECVELEADDTGPGRDQINLRGEVLPFIRLKGLFQLADASASDLPLEDASASPLPCQAPADGAQSARRDNVVVVRYGGQRAGLVVDHLMGEFQTVIRPLGAVFSGLEGVSGFTILGSGQVALILDVPGLVRRVVRRDSAVTATAHPLSS